MKKINVILSFVIIIIVAFLGVKFYLKNNQELLNYNITQNEKVKTDESMSLDEMVSNILFNDNGGRYSEGECRGEGHIILGSEEKDNMTYIYVLTMYGEYGFQDNNFVKVSGSGVIPAVIMFSENEQGEKINTIKWPLDGSAYIKSIKELFPEKYHNRVLTINKEDNEELKKQETSYAQKYLEEIGRNSIIGQFVDFEHSLLTSMGVPVHISNKLLGKAYSNYPHWIGNQERIEDGTRYVYEMNYIKDSNSIILEKYNYDTREIVEKIRINALKGEEITLKKSLTPTGFAGSSFNRIELYSNGEVYLVKYDGIGFDNENIVNDTLVAINTIDIEMFEDEGINIIGDSLSETGVLDIGWIKFNN